MRCGWEALAGRRDLPGVEVVGNGDRHAAAVVIVMVRVAGS